MNDETTPRASTLVYHPTDINCPRCHKPLKARCTASVSRIDLIKCTGCEYQIDVEAIRKHCKALAVPLNEEGP